MRTCEWYDEQEDESCDSPCEGRTSFCATHNRLLRQQKTNQQKANEKRKALLAKPKKVYKAPNKVSPKRKELNKEYFALVEQFKKDNPKCKANVNEYCTKNTEDPHHTRGRGKYLLDVGTWLPVCRSCHIFIEANPEIAKERGWSESRLAKDEPHKNLVEMIWTFANIV